MQRHREDLQRDGDFRRARKVSGQMAGMAKSLERDAQVGSLLRARRHEFGIDTDISCNLSRDLADHVSFGPAALE